MSKLIFNTVDEWIKHCFDDNKYDSQYFESYRRIFLKLLDQQNKELSIDTLTQGDELDDPDDPESWTHREGLEYILNEQFPHFLRVADEGHTLKYAEAYSFHAEQCSSPDIVSGDTYQDIGTSYEFSPDDPAYKDAYQTCLYQNKSEAFATKCAEFLFDFELSFPKAFEKTEQYEEALNTKSNEGRSPKFALNYAIELVKYETYPEAAKNYAECYEFQTEEFKRSAKEAESIAQSYKHYSMDPGFSNEYTDPDYTSLNGEGMADAEACHRFNGIHENRGLLIKTFTNVSRLRGYIIFLDEYEKVETYARKIVAGEITLKGVPGNIYQDCENEQQDTPDFSSMNEADFKSYSPKNEKEREAHETEFMFREDCRNNGYDLTDPDARSGYKEIQENTGEAFWDRQNKDDLAGYSKMMTTDYD